MKRVPPGHKYCRARAGIIVHHGDEKKNEEVWGGDEEELRWTFH